MTFSPVAEKNWSFSRGYFRSWGHVLEAVALVERWPLKRGFHKSKCRVRLSAGTKKGAVVERWPFGGSTVPKGNPNPFPQGNISLYLRGGMSEWNKIKTPQKETNKAEAQLLMLKVTLLK